MTERDSGLLWEDERSLIDAYGGIRKWEEPKESDFEGLRDPVDTKSRLKRKVATLTAIREGIETVRRDFERLELFHTRVRAQPGGRWEWNDQILPAIETEVEKLARLLGRWQAEAEREGRTAIREMLADALRPLHANLNELERMLEGEYSLEEEEQARAGADDAPAALAADVRELKARRVALLALLEDAELRVIFQYIGCFEGRKLPDRMKGGRQWAYWETRYLENEYGLTEEGAWGPQFTQRGELVDEVLWNLEALRLIERLGEGPISTAEAVLMTLPHHVGADRWDAWDEVF